MYLKYGTFVFDFAECLVSYFGIQRRYNDRGRAQTKVVRMVVEGEIIASGQDLINTRAGIILNALALDGGEVKLLKSDLSDTVYQIPAAGARSIRVLENSLLQQDGKAHFATGLPFSITFEGEYTVNDGDPIVSYEERITQIGFGGQRSVVLELDNGVPIDQTVSTNSPLTIIQSGTAVGAASYPTFNAPIFPADIRAPEDYQLTRGTPRLDGVAYVDWPIAWDYRMTLKTSVGIPSPILR